jgi:hypothetical protein
MAAAQPAGIDPTDLLPAQVDLGLGMLPTQPASTWLRPPTLRRRARSVPARHIDAIGKAIYAAATAADVFGWSSDAGEVAATAAGLSSGEVPASRPWMLCRSASGPWGHGTR